MDWLRHSSKADVAAYVIMILCLGACILLGVRSGFLFGMAKGGGIGALVGVLIGAVGGVIAGFALWLAVCLLIVAVGVLFLWFVPRK